MEKNGFHIRIHQEKNYYDNLFWGIFFVGQCNQEDPVNLVSNVFKFMGINEDQTSG